MKTITITLPTTDDLQDLVKRFLYRIDTSSYVLEEKAYLMGGKWFWQLMYWLTGRCGSRIHGHTPIFSNPHRWLWTVTTKGRVQTHSCTICGNKYVEQIKLVSRNTNFSDVGREADMKALKKSYDTATNEVEKTAIKKSMTRMIHEDKRIKDMREDLIKATRNNDHDTIKDIHDYVGSKEVYRNDR